MGDSGRQRHGLKRKMRNARQAAVKRLMREMKALEKDPPEGMVLRADGEAGCGASDSLR